MSDIKFSCGSCGQHISCDDSYAGSEISCPNCQNAMVIPGAPAAETAPAAPPTSPAKGLSIRVHHPSSPPPPPPAEPAQGAAGQSCPSCRSPLAAGAIICTNCGFNLQTGQRIAAASGRPTAPPRPVRRVDDGGDKKWNIILGVICAVLAILFALGLKGEGAALAYAGLSNLFHLVVVIIIIVDAFRQSSGQGLMTMCVPCYILYYVFGVCERDQLKVYYVVSTIAMLAVSLLKLAPSGGAQ